MTKLTKAQREALTFLQEYTAGWEVSISHLKAYCVGEATLLGLRAVGFADDGGSKGRYWSITPAGLEALRTNGASHDKA